MPAMLPLLPPVPLLAVAAEQTEDTAGRAVVMAPGLPTAALLAGTLPVGALPVGAVLPRIPATGIPRSVPAPVPSRPAVPVPVVMPGQVPGQRACGVPELLVQVALLLASAAGSVA